MLRKELPLSRDEANKRLTLAQSSVRRAEENLRMANVGFQEGVITPTTVMEAQTAWLQAQSQKIDAEIEVKLSQVELQKALGLLGASSEKAVVTNNNYQQIVEP